MRWSNQLLMKRRPHMGSHSIEVARFMSSHLVSSLTAGVRYLRLRRQPDCPATLMAEEQLKDIFIAHAECQNGRILNTMPSSVVSTSLFQRFSRPGKFG